MRQKSESISSFSFLSCSSSRFDFFFALFLTTVPTSSNEPVPEEDVDATSALVGDTAPCVDVDVRPAVRWTCGDARFGDDAFGATRTARRARLTFLSAAPPRATHRA